MSCLSVNRVVLIEAGSLIEAGGSDAIVLIEAGGRGNTVLLNHYWVPFKCFMYLVAFW